MKPLLVAKSLVIVLLTLGRECTWFVEAVHRQAFGSRNKRGNRGPRIDGRQLFNPTYG